MAANIASIAAQTALLGRLTTARNANHAAYNDQRPRIVAAIDGCNEALACLDRVNANPGGGDDTAAEEDTTAGEEAAAGEDAAVELIQRKESNKNFRSHV